MNIPHAKRAVTLPSLCRQGPATIVIEDSRVEKGGSNLPLRAEVGGEGSVWGDLIAALSFFWYEDTSRLVDARTILEFKTQSGVTSSQLIVEAWIEKLGLENVATAEAIDYKKFGLR